MPIKNLRDVVGERLAASKQAVVEKLRARLGPPPVRVAQRAQVDDEYRLFWRTADAWSDPVKAQQMEAQMYAMGAKPEQIVEAKYPDRMDVIANGDRHNNLTAQVKFCEDMIARHAELLGGVVKEQMDVLKEGPDG